MGGAAILAWAIAGVVVAVLALVHAELGAMYPVAGGTARFPHMAFGSVAGLGFGFFAYVQAVTIAPIEAFAFMIGQALDTLRFAVERNFPEAIDAVAAARMKIRLRKQSLAASSWLRSGRCLLWRGLMSRTISAV